ncbi:MAG: globin family protein [Parvularculaceae bacterium]
MITAQDVDNVQNSFAQIYKAGDHFGTLFYQRLFQIAPEVRPLFKGNLSDQQAKLMQILSMAVLDLNNTKSIIPMIRDLGRRHVDYGVKPHHYELVGATLLWTLEQALEARFTPEIKASWTKVYALLSSVMIQGAEQATAQQAAQG